MNEELEEEFEKIQAEEYRRGIRLGSDERRLTEYCPWCKKYGYSFSTLTNWYCQNCDYYPGTDLFGGKFS